MIDRAVIAALAGRRIDAPDADMARFPVSSVAAVAQALATMLREAGVDRLICSAACGADLLALEAAERLAIAATIVLPFAAEAFRRTSVTDRPGDWGGRYDRAIARAEGAGTLVDLGLGSTDAHAYDRATAHIIATTRAIPAARRLAIAVWEGVPRGPDDATADFLAQARAARLEVCEIATMR